MTRFESGNATRTCARRPAPPLWGVVGDGPDFRQEALVIRPERSVSERLDQSDRQIKHFVVRNTINGRSIP